jgi:hypothetical protein
MIIFSYHSKPGPVIRKATLILLLVLAAMQWHCIQTYVSPYRPLATGYLVVEGYISGNSSSYIRLSLSIPLPGDSAIPTVTGAQLQLEGTDSSISQFNDSADGYYILPTVALNTATRYRLRISNVNNDTYLSDYVPYKPTPPIDSVNWTRNPSGVNIYVNTHDPTGNTRYYQWKYMETWQYTSAEPSGILYKDDSLFPRPASQQIYNCWHSDSVTTVLIGTSEALSQDLIYFQPLIFIPANTRPLSVEYSVLVDQYALTDSAWQYLSEMKTSTQQLGSIFDAQPTQLTGNIHCLNDPSRLVLGFLAAGTLQQQRIWISYAQLPDWDYFFQCSLKDSLIPDDPGSLKLFFGTPAWTPIAANGFKVLTNLTSCIDCTTMGGTNQKPSFWP